MYLIFCGLIFLLSGCSGQVAGGGIETNNTISAVHADGTPAAGAGVWIHRADYIKDTSEFYDDDRTPDGYIDENGRYFLNGLPEGEYVAEVRYENLEGALFTFEIRGTEGTEIRPDTLEPLGSVSGEVVTDSITQNVFVQIRGLERIVRATPEGGYSITGLPKGTVQLHMTSTNPDVFYDEPAPAEILPGKNTVVEKVGYVIEDYGTWGNTRPIIINTSVSGAGVSGDVVGFPLLVRLDGGSFDFSGAEPGGTDIRFSKPDGTHLPYQIEQWDDASQQAAIWVRMDTVYGDNDTQSIIIHWGKPSAIDRSDGRAVFNTSSAFTGVWHYAEDPSGVAPQMLDATVHSSHGTSYGDMTSDDLVASIIGQGLDFDDAGDYIRMDGLSPLFSDGDDMTFSLWFKTPIQNKAYFIAGGKSTDNSDVFRVGISDDGEILVQTGLNETREMMGGRYDDDVWHYVVAMVDSSGVRTVYVDAVEVPGYMRTDLPPYSALTNVVSGMDWDGGNPSDRYGGIMDELCLSTQIRSFDWIKLCFETQKPGSAVVGLE